jgi:hypothetical protein
MRRPALFAPVGVAFAGMPTASPVHRDFARAFEKEIAAEDHRQMVTR